MAEQKTGFKYSLYAIIAIVVVVAVLAVATTSTFASKYIAFDPEKLAVNYADTIFQRGDGYNSYNYTLSAKSEKYGDFIRIYYMYPLIYPEYKIGMSDDDFKAIEENGYNNEKYMSDATKNDDGTLSGQLSDTMYPYYVELIKTYGWDNYDAIYSNYFSKLVEERKAIFGDDYMSDEVMFTAFESNVSTFSTAVTGSDVVYAEDGETILQEKQTGFYQEKFGEDYKITTSVVKVTPVEDLDAYKATMDSEKLKTYELTTDDISEAQTLDVEATLEDGTVVATLSVNVVKVGRTWYVDNTTTDTSSVYALLSEITA